MKYICLWLLCRQQLASVVQLWGKKSRKFSYHFIDKRTIKLSNIRYWLVLLKTLLKRLSKLLANVWKVKKSMVFLNRKFPLWLRNINFRAEKNDKSLLYKKNHDKSSLEELSILYNNPLLDIILVLAKIVHEIYVEYKFSNWKARKSQK